jgi:hypothetical protein
LSQCIKATVKSYILPFGLVPLDEEEEGIPVASNNCANGLFDIV